MSEKQRAFIMSSSEGLKLARRLKEALSDSHLRVDLWSEDAFWLSEEFLESLEAVIATADYGVAVATADDRMLTRGKAEAVARDNIWLEAGMFIGRLGRRRTFLVVPKGIHTPSDLGGLVVARYDTKKPITADVLSQIVGKIRSAMKVSPPALTHAAGARVIFPEILIKRANSLLLEFNRRVGDRPIQLPHLDAQMTIMEENGSLIQHIPALTKPQNAIDHEGKVIWTDFTTREGRHPFRAFIKSRRKKAWILWSDEGYSLNRTSTKSYNNHRVCIGRFVRHKNLIDVLELHQELQSPLDECSLKYLKAIVKERLYGLWDDA